jgi:acyl carrier protein
MLNADEIVSKLKDILNDRFGIDTSSFNGGTRLGDIGIDSLHVVDIMLDIESDLDFNFEDLSLPPNPSLEEMSVAIIKNLGNKTDI